MNEDTTFDPWDIRISVLSRGIVGAQLAIDAVPRQLGGRRCT